MVTYQEYHDTKYKPMRDAAVKVEGELLKKLIAKCQQNPWLKVGGIDLGELMCEHDYPYYLELYDDPAMLQLFFAHGNWGLRAAVQYKDLIFVNQVNAGDEWWTLKILPDGDLLAFESITFGPMIARGEFIEFLERLHKATPKQCKDLEY